MKIMYVLAGLSLLSPLCSFAAQNDVASILANYSTTDLNRKCSVELRGSKLRIRRSTSRAGEVQIRVSGIKPLAKGIWEGSDSDYTGQSNVILIEKEASLLVIAMWEDGENGFDEASYCDLEKK